MKVCLDLVTGQLHSSCNGGGAGGGFVAVEAIYVGKHGNDAQPGTDYSTAKLTLAAAIAAAAAGTGSGVPSAINQYAIICEDSGRYIETGLILPSYVHIIAPGAELNVTSGLGITTGNWNCIRLQKLQVAAGSGISQAGGSNWLHIDYGQIAGGGDLYLMTANAAVFGEIGLLIFDTGQGVRIQASSPLVALRIGELRANGAGYGVWQAGGGSFAGRTVIDVDQVRLLVNNSTAFRQNTAGNGLTVRAGTIHKGTGTTGTTAFNLGTGRISAVVNDIDVATVVNSGVNTELDLLVGKMAGAVTGAGTHNITEAGKFPYPTDYIHGAKLRYVSTSQVTVGTGGQDSAMRDSSDTFDILFNGTLACNMAVAGPGGLQSGQVEAANTWYEVHVIADSTGVNPTALLFIPTGVGFSQAGYDKSRRVGWVRNNPVSDFRYFWQSGLGSWRWYWYDYESATLTFLSGGTATSWTTVALTSYAPPTCTTFALRFDYLNTGTFDDFGVRPTGGGGVSRAGAPFNFQPSVFANTDSIRSHFIVNCNASQQIDYETQSGGPLSLQCIGFTDEV